MLLIIPGLAELAYHTVTTVPGIINSRDLPGKYKTRQVEIKELCSTVIIETQSLTSSRRLRFNLLFPCQGPTCETYTVHARKPLTL